MSRARRSMVALFAGVLVALGQAPVGLWPLALAGLVLAFRTFGDVTGWRQAFAQGFLTGFAYGAVALHWIVDPFLVDAATYGWMAPFGVLGMAIGFGVFWGAGFALGRVLAGNGTVWALVFGWSAAEIARTFLFTGFPWALLSHVWIGTPVYSIAATTGPLGLVLITLALAAALSRFRAGLVLQWSLGVAAVLGGMLVTAQMKPHVDPPNGTPHLVRLVQPNAPQHLKWDPDWSGQFFERLLALSGQPGSPDLVIWPEVSVTFRLDADDAPYDEISKAAGGRPVILGGLRVEDSQVYNSLLVLADDGTPILLYDKHHLVPFGEYAPGGALAERLGLRGLAEQLDFGFSPGPGPHMLSLPGGLTTLPMICYEAIFPSELRKVGPERPDFLLHLTNDAWFGRWAGPGQHLAQARARAVEFGLPVVRVANTGISGVIDAQGELAVSLPLGEAGFLDATVPAASPATLYWSYGDSPAILVWIVLGMLIASRRGRYRIDPTQNNL